MEKRVAQTHVVIIGSGFGGLHAAFRLRQQLPDVMITLIAKSSTFLYRPGMVYLPFGADEDGLKVPVGPPLEARNIRFVPGVVETVNPAQRFVMVEGQPISFDYLIVASGARPRLDGLPGFYRQAYLMTSLNDMRDLRLVFRELADDAVSGRSRQVVFVLAPDSHSAGPLYEMALLLQHSLPRQRQGDPPVRTSLVTWEPKLFAAVAEVHSQVFDTLFSERGIQVHVNTRAVSVDHDSLTFDTGLSLRADCLVTFPPARGEPAFSQLSCDSAGLIRVDTWTRRAEGQHTVFVVGDAAADQVVKQAYLAFSQAEVAVHHIRCDITGEIPSRVYLPRTRYLLDDGAHGLYLAGRLGEPVQVWQQSTAWRLGKRLMERYLSRQVRRGQPFADVLDLHRPATYSH